MQELSVNLLTSTNMGEVTETSNRFKSTLYKYSFMTNKGKFKTILKKLVL